MITVAQTIKGHSLIPREERYLMRKAVHKMRDKIMSAGTMAMLILHR